MDACPMLKCGRIGRLDLRGWAAGCPTCTVCMARARLRRLIARFRLSIVPGITAARPGLAGQNADDRRDGDRRDRRRRARARQRAAARRGAGADRRQFGRDLRHRLDRRRDAGARYLARDRAALDVCAGTGRRHAADRRDLARLWPPRRLHHRHRLRRADRLARRVRDPARLVLAVLLRDLSRRPLWRGVAILSLRRRRRRQRGLSSQGRVVGDGGRRVRRRARSAARAMDHGRLAALSVRVQLRDAGCGRAGGDGGALGRRCAEARAGRSAWRPAVA